MDSVQAGLRAQDIKKDTYERLICADCDERLDTKPDPKTEASIIVCPSCQKKWRDP